MKKKVIYNRSFLFVCVLIFLMILAFINSIILSRFISKASYDSLDVLDRMFWIVIMFVVVVFLGSMVVIPFLFWCVRFEKIIFDGECVHSKKLFEKISIPYNEIVEIFENHRDAVFSDHKIVVSVTIKSADEQITVYVTKKWTADKIKQMLK